MPASITSTSVEGSGTALRLAPVDPPPSETPNVEVVLARPSRLSLEVRKEFEEVSEPARSELGEDAGVVATRGRRPRA